MFLQTAEHLVKILQKTLDKCITEYDKYLIIGDLNFNLMCDKKNDIM